MLASLRGYRISWLQGDAIAGAILAAIAIPEQLATARLAGFHPAAGLVAFACGGIAFALLGRSKFLSVGADSTIAPIFASGAAAIVAASSADYMVAAAAVGVVTGALLIVAGVARAGWLADLLSRPVTVGLLAGIALNIIVAQLPAWLGISGGGDRFLDRVAVIAGQLSHTNPFALAIGAGVLIVMLVAVRIGERIPGALIGLAAASCAYVFFHLDAQGVATVGVLNVAPPHISLPMPGLNLFLTIVPLAFVVAMVCVIQSAAVLRSFPSQKDGDEDVSDDFAAIGAGSVLSGVFGSFAVDASPSRTAIFARSGGQSQLGSLIAIALAILVAAFFSGVFVYVPEAALAAILIFIATRLFNLDAMRHVAQNSRREFMLLVLSVLLVTLLRIEIGMLLAIIISLAQGIRLVMFPTTTKYFREPGTTIWWPPMPGVAEEEVPGVLVFGPQAPLNFTNAVFVHKQLLAAVAQEKTPVKLIVIEASGVTDIDYTGAQSAERSIREFRARGIDVALARLSSEHARFRAEKSGLLAVLGEDHLFLSVQEAVDKLGPK